MGNKKDFDFEQARKDEDNLTKAGNGWEEDTGDEAVELLKSIRGDVEED